ncbi:MAG: AAA family ATPase [Cyanobacteria bacterium P01_E01_bin.42]
MNLPQIQNYRLEILIHKSDRTLVYRGRKEENEQPVIIKLMCNEYPSFNELVQFRNQYAIALNLDIQGIVKLHGLERYQNGYALVMEDSDSISLAEYQRQFPLSINQFLEISLQLAETLHQLHQNQIIHKDIKPANILIHPETKQVQLIDFSISSLLPKETPSLQTPNVLEGTLAYVSPEQTGRMNRGIDYRSDFYSLGVTFYELLVGNVPFNSKDPLELIHAHLAQRPDPLVRWIGLEGKFCPQPLSDIVMKLMAKNAEDRYQSALGLKHDLKKCWHQWQKTGKIEAFPLGKQDRSDRFLIPEKLYGREQEVQALLEAFEGVAAGKTEMMLVAGYSGIGKTAVINEVHKPIARAQGYFIKGKFDQFNRNIPFSAFVQAFRDLMGQILGESDAQLQQWQEKILKAVGEQGQVLVEVIPELERIVGKQPPVPELEGTAAQNRFNLLFEKFISVFTTKKHPLTLFLDDLQWADSASLNLLKVLIGGEGTGYLLLLGAYRDNEVFPAHPLVLTLGDLEKQNTTISTITLTPLSVVHINELVAETLSCSGELAKPLTDLIYQKTAGNPFFTTQFLKGLHQDGLIAFNHNLGYWECDLVKVTDAALTDDVVEFMAGRLYKLPEPTQNLLKLAACIGNQFDLDTLAIVCQTPSEEVAANLWSALREGLALPQSEAYKFFQGEENREKKAEGIVVGYRFLHDRVQQAAYSLIPEQEKTKVHYRIGRLLLENIPRQEREERIFELVGQLNYGIEEIYQPQEKEELARLNLIACRRAKNATAYQAGREYNGIGLSLLGENPWHEQYAMTLALSELAVELASLCGEWEEMDRFVGEVVSNSHSLVEQTNVYRIQIQASTSRQQLTKAISIALGFLQQLGVTIPEDPTEADVGKAIARVRELMVGREVEDLLDLPEMTDPEKIAIVQTSRAISPATYTRNPLLFTLIVCRSVSLSIQYGNIPASSSVYTYYGAVIASSGTADVMTGVKFGQLALQLVDKLDAKTTQPEVFATASYLLLHRMSHPQENLSLQQVGYTSALETGNYEFAGYNAHGFCVNAFWGGSLLESLVEEARAYCRTLVQINQLNTVDYTQLHWQTMLNLLGRSQNPTLLSGEACQESKASSHQDVQVLAFFHTYKLMLCYLFGDIESALKQIDAGRQCLFGTTGTLNVTGFHFYAALSLLATQQSTSEKTVEILSQVEADISFLQHWANYAPMNHQHKVDLVKAEKCRVLEQKLEAIELYDKAIAGARENGYLQEEALANELFAKFYLDWSFDSTQRSTEPSRSPNGKEQYAALHMQEAYYGYARWGAKAKTDRLEKRYPQLLAPILQRQQLGLTDKSTLSTFTQGKVASTNTSTGDLFDLASLMKASRSLSQEIDLERAIANFMEVIGANAGAETVALMLFEAEKLILVARWTVAKRSVTGMPVESSDNVPLTLINQVKHTGKPLILDDARAANNYAGDAYIQTQQPQSVLCLPLINRGHIIGILYLENNQAKGAFTSDRVETLNLLCSQAAISLENARLYRQAQQALIDLQQAQLQLIQSEKMATLGNLVAGVAHEINNPVGFIGGNVGAAQDYLQDLLEILSLYQENTAPPEAIASAIADLDPEFIAEDFPKLIASMQSICDRILNISTSLRAFSRTDTNQKTEFNLHDGLDSTLLILKYRLKANEQRPAIEIVKQYGEISAVKCYAGQLNQVFMNLLANAIDAIEEGNAGKTYEELEKAPNRIIINTQFNRDKSNVIVRITDNGKGMSEAVKVKIFEQGFTTKGVGKGTGLGMAIAYQIITEKHGGAIACRSEVGEGTEFIISLPLEP